MIKQFVLGPFETNTFIVSLNGSDVFITDPAGCPATQDQYVLLEYLEKNNLNPKAVFLTHGHFDHLWGLPFLKEKYPDIPVIIHDADKDFLGKSGETAQKRAIKIMTPYFGILSNYVNNLPEPDWTIKEDITLDKILQIPGFENWQVMHTPGHTKGSCCLYNQKEGLFISGDTIFYGNGFGRTDGPGGSDEELFKSINKIKKNIPGNTKIYPGHGPSDFTLI